MDDETLRMFADVMEKEKQWQASWHEAMADVKEQVRSDRAKFWRCWWCYFLIVIGGLIGIYSALMDSGLALNISAVVWDNPTHSRQVAVSVGICLLLAVLCDEIGWPSFRQMFWGSDEKLNELEELEKSLKGDLQ